MANTSQDVIAQKLDDLRKLAAQRFQQIYGQHGVGMGNATYTIESVDSKGYITLKNTTTGKLEKNFDPTQAIYKSASISNYTTQLNNTYGGGTTSPNTSSGSNPLQTLMGFGSIASPLLAFLKKPNSDTVNKSWNVPSDQVSTPGFSQIIQPIEKTYSIYPPKATVAAPIGPQAPSVSPDTLKNLQSQYASNNEKLPLLESQRNILLQSTQGVATPQLGSQIKEFDDAIKSLQAQQKSLSDQWAGLTGTPISDTSSFDRIINQAEQQQQQFIEDSLNFAINQKNADFDFRVTKASLEASVDNFQKAYKQQIADAAHKAEVNQRVANSIASDRKMFLGGVLGGALSGFGLNASLEKLWDQFSLSGLSGAIASFAGLATSLHFINEALSRTASLSTLLHFNSPLLKWLNPIINKLTPVFKFLSSGWGIVAITAAIILLTWLLSRKKPPELQAGLDLNDELDQTVWNDGPVVALSKMPALLMAGGLAMSSMGINLAPSLPDNVMLSQTMMDQVLTDAGGQAPTGTDRYATTFVLQAKGQPTKVVYIEKVGTDSKGNVMERAHVVTLDKNVTFTNPGNNVYTPFFVRDSQGKATYNKQVAISQNEQDKLCKAAASGLLSTEDAQRAAIYCSATNKNAQSSGGGS